MSPLLRSLVDADNQRPGPSSDDRTRVYATLGVSLGLIPAGAVVAAHAASAATATQLTATAAAASGGTSTVATAVGAASAVGRLALFIKAPLMTVGVGAVLGAALTAYVVKSPAARSTATAARKAVAASVLATRTAPAAPVTAPVALPLAEAAAPAERPAAPAERPIAMRTTPVHHERVAVATEAPPLAGEQHADDVVRADGALTAEQALLDPARAALARGDGRDALAHLELHERRFPGGALAQEREAMTIRALGLVGDRSLARARASTFRARYPDSLLWPMIQATLATLATHDAALSARP
ncbi:MAG TPA: hypothetical protein VK989_16945 [Polyangia bacterium]|jgi:hypothetical protein|nr:hypothetical protein [Polyangia bacterium]